MSKKMSVLKTPLINENKNNEFKVDDKLLQELIDRFVMVLEKNISRDKLILLYNNLSTLKIESKRIIYEVIAGIFKNSTVTGEYYLDDNIISILPLEDSSKFKKFISMNASEYIANLYHELLHMASTIKSESGRVAFSGLSQVRTEDSIGVALDDGYTEILLYRYFDLDKEYMSYNYEVLIISLLEEIISKDRMTELYFTANLYDFVSELEKYNSRNNIIKFMNDLDSLYVLEDHTKIYRKDIIYYHNEITRFIVDTYRRKFKIDLYNKCIDFDEYNNRLNNIIEKLHMAFEALDLEEVKTRTR